MSGKAIFVICIIYARQQELGPNADDKGGSRITSGGQVENGMGVGVSTEKQTEKHYSEQCEDSIVHILSIQLQCISNFVHIACLLVHSVTR